MIGKEGFTGTSISRTRWTWHLLPSPQLLYCSESGVDDNIVLGPSQTKVHVVSYEDAVPHSVVEFLAWISLRTLLGRAVVDGRAERDEEPREGFPVDLFVRGIPVFVASRCKL